MEFIKVWCEYDFGGQFGGNNNQDVFAVDSGLPDEVVNNLVKDRLYSDTGVGAEDLDDDLFGWEYIIVGTL